MRNSIMDLSSPSVAQLLTRSPLVAISLGSVEQHGPHLPCGTDTFAAETVTKKVAQLLDAMYVPFGPYGVTPIHAGHPGTVSLRRSTFEALLTDVLCELAHMGARTFLLVNWHEGNTPSMDAVSYSLQRELDVTIVVVQACYVAQRIYQDLGGELTHGGGIETLAVMAHDPALVRLESVGQPTRPLGAEQLDAMRRSHEVYSFVTDVTQLADEGWYGNPWWATEQAASTFAERTANECVAMINRVRQVHSLATQRASRDVASS